MTEEFEVVQAPASSCEQTLSRAEFIARVVKGAALTGGLLAAPKILDKFLVPPAFAGSSSCVVGNSTVQGGADTIVNLGGANLYARCNVNPSAASVCSNGADPSLLSNCL